MEVSTPSKRGGEIKQDEGEKTCNGKNQQVLARSNREENIHEAVKERDKQLSPIRDGASKPSGIKEQGQTGQTKAAGFNYSSAW